MASDNNVSMAPEVGNVLSEDEYNKSIQNIHTHYDEYMKVGSEIMEAYYKNKDEAVKKYGEFNENNDTKEQVERLDKIKELINKEGSTLLHNAIYKNDYNNVMFLIGQKAHLNKEDNNGLIPVKIALKQKKWFLNDFDLLIPNAFTPNGDGFNDLYVIRGMMPDHVENEFYVFDFRRQLVYSAQNYSNTWNGTDNKGNRLLTGTYYGVFKSKGLEKPFTTVIDLRYE